jgi:glycine oxidase
MSGSRSAASPGRAYDVAVVGAGIIGASAAREMALRGLRVVVLEKADRPGRESSAAAGGVLAPNAEAEPGTPLYAMKRRGLDLYPDWVAAIAGESGVDPEFSCDGLLAVALDPAAEAANEKREAFVRRSGFRAERLASKEALAREPALAGGVRSAVYFPDEGRVDNARLSEAVALAAHRRGVEFRCGNPALSLLRSGSRVTGVRTPVGDVAAGTVVLAAGAWSPRVEGLPFPIPVKPVRGQIVVLRAPAPPIGSVVSCDEVYAVPRNDGRLLIGATVEDVGFDKSVTAGAVRWLLEGAARFLPGVDALPVETSWAGLRPEAADHLPIVGRAPGAVGLVLATGHFRAGIVLAPLTARAVAAVVAGEPLEADLAACDPGRFAPR